MEHAHATELVVKVTTAHRGRVTGHSVSCPDHGTMPVLAPGRSAAVVAAGRHVEHEHGGRGRVVVVGEGNE